MTEPTIVLVDAPDRIEDPEFGLIGRESQRTYKVSDGTTTHTVKVDRDPGSAYQYRVQNLVGNKWHTLLTGDTVDNGKIPFDEAAARAAAVLL